MTAATRPAFLPTILALLLGCSAAASAQITTDGSVGPVVSLSGPTMTIGESLGTAQGGNLFHSFGTFSIPAGATATFTAASSYANVIARVTGGSPSSILGNLNSTVMNGAAGANLLLFNPAGIAFGPTATINVAGSFHASTANYIGFADGSRFMATPGGGGLTVASPTAFGFLVDRPAPITVTGATLRGAHGTSIGLVGGDVHLSGATVSNRPPPPNPSSLDKLQIAAAGLGEVPIDPSQGAGSALRGGSVTLVNSVVTIGNANTASQGIFIRGGQLVATGTATDIRSSDGTGAEGGSIVIDVAASGSTSIVNGAKIRTSTARAMSSTKAGSITVRTGDFFLGGGAFMVSDTFNEGNAGRITIAASGNVTLADGNIATSVRDRVGLPGPPWQPGPADAGDIAISGRNITIGATPGGPRFGPANAPIVGGVRSQNTRTIAPGAGGRAGTIKLTAIDSIRISGTEISTLATTGDGGNIDVRATRIIDIKDSTVSAEVRGGSGAGGNILIDPQVVVIDSSVLTASAFGGPGGNITIVGNLVLISQDSRLTASSATSIDGTVTVSSGDSDVSGELAVVDARVANAGDQLRPGCAARSAGSANTFAAAARGGLPASAGGPILAYSSGAHGQRAQTGGSAAVPGAQIASGVSLASLGC